MGWACEVSRDTCPFPLGQEPSAGSWLCCCSHSWPWLSPTQERCLPPTARGQHVTCLYSKDLMKGSLHLEARWGPCRSIAMPSQLLRACCCLFCVELVHSCMRATMGRRRPCCRGAARSTSPYLTSSGNHRSHLRGFLGHPSTSGSRERQVRPASCWKG